MHWWKWDRWRLRISRRGIVALAVLGGLLQMRIGAFGVKKGDNG
jgi:hypothetical protein